MVPAVQRGLYVSAETEQDLTEALDKALGCPMLSQKAPDSAATPQ